jgi:transcription initiation factor TFIIB
MTTRYHGMDECPSCGSNAIERWEDLQSWICNNCSVVIDGKEGSNLPDTHDDGDASGNQERGPSNENWQDGIAATDKSEANLIEALTQVEKSGSAFSLSDDAILRTGELVKEAWKSNFMHGRTMEGTVAAAIYTASREFGCSIPPGAIAEESDVDKQSIIKTYRQLKAAQEVELSPPIPSEYVDYICTKLDLPENAKTDALVLLEDHDSASGNPIGVAAAGIYEIARKRPENPTLREVAEVCCLTKETIWRHTQKF